MTETGLPLTLHARYGRREIFKSVGVAYSQKNQNQNTGLSPRCPDAGYFIFITLNKSGMNPAYDYEDELFTDSLQWITRRGRRENHPDYVNLRQAQTRVSLFARANEGEGFVYLGELEYQTHREFKSADGRPQQEYEFRLKQRLSDELLWRLTAGLDRRMKAGGRRASRTAPGGSRRPASLDDYKKAFSYALDRLGRVVNPAHHNYQVRLSRYFESRGVAAVWEKDFIDVMFSMGSARFIGEIKVTGYLRLDEAFRTALGQLLEYAHLKFNEPPGLVMLLDRDLDERRLALATKLGIAVIVEEGQEYRILNPELHAGLAGLFSEASR